MKRERIIDEIIGKYTRIGEDPDTYLNGLLLSNPLNYWDYIELDILLSLQKPKTHYKDEETFILYNQIAELILKLMLNEIKQLTGINNPTEDVLIDKLKRLNRYVRMLISLFCIMRNSLDYDEYNAFRVVLAPASGFQSVQFRYLELYCTRLENLINVKEKKEIKEGEEIEKYFEYLYWKEAGMNRETGDKTFTLQQFEFKYQDELISLAKKVRGKTLEDKITCIENPSDDLKILLRCFDRLYNFEWPGVHLRIANYYLNRDGKSKSSTGNSDWKKYLNPKIHGRKFFPSLWT